MATNERDIFEQALELENPDERAAYLTQACGDNAALRSRVEALLYSHQEAGSFLRGAAGLSATIAEQISERPGSQVGPYRLLEQIGEGGMGIVFMAQQTQPVQRRVATKVIKPGMDTRQVIARFEAERQALSLMDHPNIAKVLDAGATTSGLPYFVMELVQGRPITDYCDQQRLTLRQRLQLMIPVCQAIQHAHQKGIIHRDIKPSNILVAEYDEHPVPKVIDFGVAKATNQSLTEKTMFTGMGQIIGTLEYMSPEQAKVNQLDIDTRSDIYSLGVLMYELLTGTTPFDKQRLRSAAWDEMLRIIREEEPPRPSTKLSSSATLPSVPANRSMELTRLSRTIRGELDWIVMKALEKDRGRRYETANGLAQDIQRYLADEPVTACPPSATYRIMKFVRRNKGGLAAASVLAAASLVAVSGIGWAVRDRSAQRAERLTRTTTQVELILADVEGLMTEQRWDEALTVAKRAEATLAGGETDASTAERVRELLRDLEFVDRLEQIRMQQVAWVDRTFDYRGADWAYAEAFRDYGVDINELEVETSIERLKIRPALAIRLASALDNWAIARRMMPKWDESQLMRLVNIARGIDPDAERDMARSGWGRPDSEIVDQLRPLVESFDVRSQNPASLAALASRLDLVGQPDLAARLLREAQEAYPEDFWLNFQLAKELGVKNDYSDSMRFYTAAVSLRPQAGAAYNNLGTCLHAQERFDESIECFRKAIEVDPTLSYAHCNLGIALLSSNQLDEAAACFRKSIEFDPYFVIPLRYLAAFHESRNELSEAESIRRQSLEASRETYPDGSLQTAEDAEKLASLLTRIPGREVEAEPLVREALSLRRRMQGEGAKQTADTALGLAELLALLGRYDEAESTMLEAHAALVANRDPELPREFELGQLLGIARQYQALGRPESAAEWERRAIDTLTQRGQTLAPYDPDHRSNIDDLVEDYTFLARYFCQSGRFGEAVTEFDKANQMYPGNHWLLYRAASVYLYLGDVERYREACKVLLDQGDQLGAKDPKFAERAAKACSLAPDVVADFSRVEKLAQSSVTGTEGHEWYRYFVLAKGLTEYRGGHDLQAIEWLNRFAPQSAGTHIDAIGFATLAMAQHRLGRSEEALASLTSARNITPGDKLTEKLGGNDWQDWLQSEILYREAVRTLTSL